jgi:protein-L-isoaspartate(D-aspartate) O-methyltransferase
MIEQQIRPWGILEPRVLEVLSIIKRELFVQEAQTTLAFSDIQLPILPDQPLTKNSAVMLEPRIEARILQAIMPHGKEEVLEVGSGSGYMAALLGYFAKFVTTVELNPAISEFATVNLNKCRIPNVRVEVGDALDRKSVV